jgi:hypothetical protein
VSTTKYPEVKKAHIVPKRYLRNFADGVLPRRATRCAASAISGSVR